MAKPLVFEIPHELGREEARRRLEQSFHRIRDKVLTRAAALEDRWDGDQFSFTGHAWGQTVFGQINVSDKNVRVELSLPVLLAAMADTVVGRIGREAKLLLEKK